MTGPDGMLTTAEYRARVAAEMSEAALQQQTITLARTLGWRAYHPYDSRRSVKGFPDLVLVNPRHGAVLFRELKTARGRLTPEQRDWLTALKFAGQDADVWRPADLLSGVIEASLQASAADTVAARLTRALAVRGEHRPERSPVLGARATCRACTPLGEAPPVTWPCRPLIDALLVIVE